MEPLVLQNWVQKFLGLKPMAEIPKQIQNPTYTNTPVQMTTQKPVEATKIKVI